MKADCGLDTYTFRAKNGFVYGMWAMMRFGGKYTGSYPNGFVKRCKVLLGEGRWLHVFSGSVVGDTSFDADLVGHPTYVGLIQNGLPWSDNIFDATLADPPYSPKVGSARERKMPSLRFVLSEMTRVTKPGGYVAILHWLVPATPKGCEKWGCIGLMTGANKRIRALTIFRKSP